MHPPTPAQHSLISRLFRQKKAGLILLLLVASILLVQDFTGRIFGKWHHCRVAPASANMPEMVKPRYPTAIPAEEHLQRQMRLTQDGRSLRGPFRFMADTQQSGPGTFMLGEKTFWVAPYTKGVPDPQTARYELWISREVPHWLKWPIYFALLLLLLAKVRGYYQAHPLNENKLPYLEALRGVACLVVVVTHFIGVFYPALKDPVVEGKAWYDVVSLHRYIPFASLVNAGAFAVDTFFVLSGFVLFLPFAGPGAVDMLRVREAFLRRPVRLFGVAAAVMIIVWLLRQSGIYFENSHVPAKSWTGFLEDLSMAYTTSIQYSPVFWTIRIELWGSFIVYLLAMLVGGSWARWLAYPALVWLLRDGAYANFIFGALLADLMKSFTLPGFLLWLRRIAPVLFVLGLLVGLQMDHDNLKQGVDYWAGQFMPDIAALLPNRRHGLAGAILVVSALLLSPWLQRRFTHRWFNSLGRQSYSIYGIHEVIIFAFVCWIFLAIVPVNAPTVWDIMPNGGFYHVGVLITFIAYLVMVWVASVALTAFVDEPFIRIAQKLARFVSGNRSERKEHPAAPAGIGVLPGAVGTADLK